MCGRAETFFDEDINNKHKCSYCGDLYSACVNDTKKPSLPFVGCGHRFCQECIESNGGWQKCPIDNCPGQNSCAKSLNTDHELTKQVIIKSCKEMDNEAELNNDVNTDDVAESRHGNQSLTSG